MSDISWDMRQTDPAKPTPNRGPVQDRILAPDGARVTGWIEALVRAIDACRSAPPADPVVDETLADLEGITRSCLDQIGDFTIRVEAFDFLFGNVCIFHHTKARESSLTGSLFESGVRGIVIRW